MASGKIPRTWDAWWYDRVAEMFPARVEEAIWRDRRAVVGVTRDGKFLKKREK